MERERNGSGTIVTVIVKRSVSATPNIRPTADCVYRPDCVLDAVGRIGWCVGNSVAQHRAISTNHRMRIGEIKAWSSRFRIVVIALDRLRLLNTRRRVIGDLNRLCRLRLSTKRERLQRSAIGDARRVNSFARPRRLRLRLRVNERKQRTQDEKTAQHASVGSGFRSNCKLITLSRAPLGLRE